MAAITGTVLTAAALVRFGLLARASFSNAQRLAANARMEQAPTNVGVLFYNPDNRAALSSNINSMYNQGRTTVPTLTPGAAALDVNVLRGTTNSNKPK
ncbi:MAG: hypothetical protein K0R48_620 [Gammaproteobacteria bacterium]|jgi:hypothetical protein|nr:hypothetical protein [Gammaproteobacteria bacterium]